MMRQKRRKRVHTAALESTALLLSASLSWEIWLRLRSQEWWNGVNTIWQWRMNVKFFKWIGKHLAFLFDCVHIRNCPIMKHFTRLTLCINMCWHYGGLRQEPVIMLWDIFCTITTVVTSELTWSLDVNVQKIIKWADVSFRFRTFFEYGPYQMWKN